MGDTRTFATHKRAHTKPSSSAKKKKASIASSCPHGAFEVAEKIPMLKQVSILAREIGS